MVCRAHEPDRRSLAHAWDVARGAAVGIWHAGGQITHGAAAQAPEAHFYSREFEAAGGLHERCPEIRRIQPGNHSPVFSPVSRWDFAGRRIENDVPHV